MPEIIDQSYGPEARHRLDLYPATKPTAIIIFWHGGSWKSGDKRRYRFLGRRLAKMGYTAVLPNYRLYPEVRFPGLMADAALAVRWAQDNLNPKRIILMGHSAGALLAADLALDSRYLKAAAVRSDLIKGFVGLSGPYDFTPSPTLARVFAGSPAERWEPIKLVQAPAHPMLLIHGRLDPIVGYQNALSLATAVQERGGRVRAVIYPHLEHMLTVAPFLPGLTWLAPVRRQIKRFIEELPN